MFAIGQLIDHREYSFWRSFDRDFSLDVVIPGEHHTNAQKYQNQNRCRSNHANKNSSHIATVDLGSAVQDPNVLF